MKKTNSTSFSSKVWGWLVTLGFVLTVSVNATAQCTLVCNNLVQVSLDQDCEQEIEPDMILEGGGCPNGNLQVQAKINNVWVPASGNFVANSAHINQTIQVRVRDLNSGNYCWGYIHVEDKLAPQVTCQDITLSCAITTYSPAYLFDQLGIDQAYPNVEENCSSTTQSYIDTWHDLTCTGTINGLSDISAYVKRIWTVADASGNVAICTQYIYFARRHVGNVVFPSDVTVSCENPVTDPSETGTPYINDFGQQFPIYPGNTFCELNATYTDQILPICDGTYKILRTWTVYDWCLPTTPAPPFTNPTYHIQLIKVNDDAGPVVECPEDMTVGTNPNDCERDLNLPDVIITDNCSRIASIEAVWNGSSLDGTLTTFPGNNFWNPDTLGVLGVAPNLPIGTTVMTYIITDDCGNSTVCTFNITVEDDTPPDVACTKYTQVSLGVNGMVFINASTFDQGSYDNCSPIFFKVRRMDANPCQPVTSFYDQVKFCCEDIGDTITVILRVYDVPVPPDSVALDYEEWHANDCMVQVFVDDKLKPTCSAPPNVTVSCEAFDASLWAYGTATATDNCCLDTIIKTVSYTLFDTTCNKGTINRTFRAVDCAGQSSTCTQRIIVTYNQNYYIKFPNDVIITSCDGTGNFGQPVFSGGQDCELLGVSHEDQIFTVVPDACYKIERTWTIINWCTYDPNGTCITIPNPNPNATTNSPLNLPGPIVSACGTPAPWAPTVVAISPGQPQTNYCNFWQANANCYKYKQIIKVIDGQKPTITCPASPVEFCDDTPNNPQLWNESYWWDGVHGLHDLCEGPANLSITATDACSGANINISFLLFLDLDGDGTMETVINSNNLPAPGTVNFNNLGNPNFSGGDPRVFDERPVLPNDIYRWALHQTLNGSSRTASVQWKTFSQMPTPANQFGLAGVAPEIPYGTHKIKWLVTDGCGNEQTCEYTFVVKDCKPPTVVCHDGLSVNIMPSGMITIWALDFLQYAQDNCTPPTSTIPTPNQLKFAIRKAGAGTGFPVDAQGDPITSVTFDCTELGDQAVELWAQDAAGNAAYCQASITVQDPDGACQPGVPKIAGALKTEMDDPLEDAAVNLQGTPPNGGAQVDLTDMTDDSGIYSFTNALPMGSDYTLTPLKDDNHLNGVSTFDLVLISKHILGIEPLNSPYKMIAADANKSNSVTTFDIVEIRKLILGIYTELPGNTSWRFVDKNYVFPNPANPFQDQFPESVSVLNMQTSGFNDDFVSIKTGDVNNTAIANSLMSSDDRSSNTLYFDVQDRAVKAGEEFVVDFKAAEKTAGYQFTLNTNGLEVVGIIPGDNMQTDNFAVFSDAVTASVDGNAGAFSVRFRATQAGELSKMLGFSHRITRAEAYSVIEGNYSNYSNYVMDVALRFNGANGAIVSGPGFELLQNVPNPVSSTTAISFNLPESAVATLTISNAEGRIIKVVKGAFAKGLNTVTLHRADLSTGLLFYQLDTPTHSAVKKMVV
ncbi:MAG TPA: HYR domain-containing protein, partial [Saprospiraceae bacterium]|nr:HYR domain-containing protein [Saprospiraceae bacterium]